MDGLNERLVREHFCLGMAVENGTVAGVAVQEAADGPFQSGVGIACDKSLRFLLYSETSNIAYIYSINEIRTN